MDKSLLRFVYLLVAVAAVFIIILGIQSSAYIINSILLAAMITIAVMPIPRRLMERGWNPTLSLVVTLLVVVGVLALLVFLTWISIGRMAAAVTTTGTQVSDVTSADGQRQIQLLLQRFRELATNNDATQMLASVVSIVSGAIGQSITVLMILIFMLSAVISTPISEQLEQVGGNDKLARFTDLTRDVQQYISITTVINVLVGLLNTLFLWVVGVDYAILWGILAWLMGYIPVVGFWIALIPPVLLAWAQFGLPTAILVFAAYVVINGTAENLVKPRMMGEGLNISPLVIFVSLVFWGWVLGGVGAILAVPLTLLVLSVLRSFEATSWIASLAEAGPAKEGERRVASKRLGDLWGSAKHALRGDGGEDENKDDIQSVSEESAT